MRKHKQGTSSLGLTGLPYAVKLMQRPTFVSTLRSFSVCHSQLFLVSFPYSLHHPIPVKAKEHPKVLKRKEAYRL